MENNLTKLGERNVPLCSLETRFRPNFGPIKGKADARKAEAGNPRIGGFPRSWVAPFNISSPLSLSPVESLPRPDVYIAREKGRWKRRSLCFGNWPNPAMFSICSKAPLVQQPKTGRRSLRGDEQLFVVPQSWRFLRENRNEKFIKGRCHR